jgi:putative ABC transport system permease protein
MVGEQEFGYSLRETFQAAVRTLSQDGRLAIRNVVRQKQRSGVGLISVAAGVAALILAGGFIDWIYWSMRENTIGSRLGHLQIVRAGYFDAGAADPFAYLLPNNAAASESIARLPGVKAVAPRLSLSGLISRGDATISFLGEGIDPILEAPLNRFVLITSGEPLSASEPRGIIVGKGLADNLGVKVGDDVVLITNRQSGGINAVEARVRGLFSTASKAYDDSALRLPISVAKELLRASGAHAWVVILDDTKWTDAVADQIRTIVAADRLEVVPWYRLADSYKKTVALFSKQVGVLKFIIAAIIILSISNTLTMSVLERTSEIGTMMALGATGNTILRRFLGEGAVLGVLGGLIGVIAGVALAIVISAVGIPMPAPPGVARGYVGEVRVTFALVFDAFALAVVTTLIASCYPAWKASRMAIVDALRHAR